MSCVGLQHHFISSHHDYQWDERHNSQVPRSQNKTRTYQPQCMYEPTTMDHDAHLQHACRLPEFRLSAPLRRQPSRSLRYATPTLLDGKERKEKTSFPSNNLLPYIVPRPSTVGAPGESNRSPLSEAVGRYIRRFDEWR